MVRFLLLSVLLMPQIPRWTWLALNPEASAPDISKRLNERLGNLQSQLQNVDKYPTLDGEVGVLDWSYPYGDVRRYGAVGDGVTDDTTAIQNAFTSLTAFDGGVVWFDTGVWTVSSSIMVGAGAKTIAGVGMDFGNSAQRYHNQWGSVVRVASNGIMAGVPVFDLSGSGITTIANLAFSVAGDDQTANTTEAISDHTAGCQPVNIRQCAFTNFGGVVLHVGSGSGSIQHCYARNCNSHFIHLNNNLHATGTPTDMFIAWNDLGSSANGCGLLLTVSANNTIIGNQFFNCLYGIRAVDGSYGNRIEGNRCEKNTHHGIAIENGSGNTSGNLVVGNYCFNNGRNNGTGTGGSGIVIDAPDCAVVGNKCRQDASQGDFGYQQDGIQIADEGDRCLCVGNSIDTQERYGIQVVGSDCRVEGNHIYLVDEQGIYVSGPDNAVRGNTVIACGQTTDDTYDGILLAVGADRNVVAANTVRSGGGSEQPRYGVRVNSSVTDAIVEHNDLRGAGRQVGVSDAGTRTTKRRNLYITDGVSTGSVALVNGTATVTTTEIRTADNVLLTKTAGSGTTRGILEVGTITQGTSFVVNAVDLTGVVSADDDSTVYWEIVH